MRTTLAAMVACLAVLVLADYLAWRRRHLEMWR